MYSIDIFLNLNARKSLALTLVQKLEEGRRARPRNGVPPHPQLASNMELAAFPKPSQLESLTQQN